MEELADKVVPIQIRGNGDELKGVPAEGLTEADALKEITELAKMNKVLKSFIGMGYVRTFNLLLSRKRINIIPK